MPSIEVLTVNTGMSDFIFTGFFQPYYDIGSFCPQLTMVLIPFTVVVCPKEPYGITGTVLRKAYTTGSGTLNL